MLKICQLYINSNTYFIHGDRDVRVFAVHAQQFYQALTELHIPTRLILYRGEGHGFNNPLNTADAIKEMLLRGIKNYIQSQNKLSMLLYTIRITEWSATP